jgi:hypothetical protein
MISLQKGLRDRMSTTSLYWRTVWREKKCQAVFPEGANQWKACWE